MKTTLNLLLLALSLSACSTWTGNPEDIETLRITDPDEAETFRIGISDFPIARDFELRLCASAIEIVWGDERLFYEFRPIVVSPGTTDFSSLVEVQRSDLLDVPLSETYLNVRVVDKCEDEMGSSSASVISKNGVSSSHRHGWIEWIPFQNSQLGQISYGFLRREIALLALRRSLGWIIFLPEGDAKAQGLLDLDNIEEGNAETTVE